MRNKQHHGPLNSYATLDTHIRSQQRPSPAPPVRPPVQQARGWLQGAHMQDASQPWTFSLASAGMQRGAVD